MMLPLPILEDYELSPITGFLPTSPPLAKLPQRYFRPWEIVMESFNALILAGRLRDVVDELPRLNTSLLRNNAERRRAFIILAFLSHAYVWGGPSPSQHLPACIAVPWDEVSQALEVKPVISHAAVCLWNWRPIFDKEPLSLANLTTLYTFTGSSDESWFYLISTSMESRGAPTLSILLKAIDAARRNAVAEFTLHLRGLAIHLDDMAVALTRMHEQCDPYVFFNKIRPFLAGWKNMEAAGMPHGLKYYGCSSSPDGEQRRYSGGSNAQSALIHMLDIALGVEHHQTGESAQDSLRRPKNDFMEDMRNYMPANHRRFLEDLSKVVNIREFALRHANNVILIEAYDACLAMLKTFRDKHLNIVSRYIVVPSANARAALKRSESDGKSTQGLASVIVDSKKELRGTGGTSLISFLKQSRDETSKGYVSNWAKILINNGYGKVDIQKANEKVFVGFAEQIAQDWDCSNSGGFCTTG